MRFGPLTVEQWDQTLHQVEVLVPPSPPPTPPSPATSPPHSPSPPLTWAARVARNSKPSSASFFPSSSPSSSSANIISSTVPHRSFPTTPVRVPSRLLRGMINSGTSCFVNVVLQALLACEPFRALLLRVKNVPPHSMLSKWVRLAHETAVYPDGEHKKNSTSDNHKDSKHYPFMSDDPIYPDWFYDILTSLDTQEDAREFLDCVLSDLHDETRNMLLAKAKAKLGPNGKAADNSLHRYSKSKQTTMVNKSNINSTPSSNWEDYNHPNSENFNNDDDEYDGLGNDLIDTQDQMNNIDNEGWEEVTVKGRKVEIHGDEFEPSPISKIFGGSLRSEVTRMHRKPSVTKEPFFCLALNIESPAIRTIEDAITAFCEPEFVGETANGKISDDLLRKQVLFQSLPKVLILQLKRYEKGLGGLQKVDRTLQIPEILSLRRHLVHSPKGKRAWGPDKKYSLIAAITHIGSEIGNGHYTCDVRCSNDKGETFWTTCDDSKLTPTSIKKVCWKPAYLLFYSAL